MSETVSQHINHKSLASSNDALGEFTLPWFWLGWGSYLTAIYLVVFLFDPWFDSTLYRHIAFQFPLLVGLGIIPGYLLIGKWLKTDSISIHLGVLLFFLATLSYWMLPVSIDSAAISEKTDLTLAGTLFFAGLLLGSQIKWIRIEIKLAFFFMLSTMLLIPGVVLKQINMLLCGTYTITQQKILATYLIIGGIITLVSSLVYLGFSLRPDNSYSPTHNHANYDATEQGAAKTEHPPT